MLQAEDSVLQCSFCKKQIPEGLYYKVEGKIYCPECYKTHIQVICDYCGKPIEGEYHIDYWGNKFHSFHEKETEKCEFCNRLISEKITGGGKKYADGTNICNICFSNSIQDDDRARIIMREVSDELRWLGIDIENSDEISLRLVDKNELMVVAKNTKIIPHQKGISVHNYTISSQNEISDESFSIYILKGLPELHFVKVIAHELMHVWQYKNAPLNNDIVLSEGSCNYAAYLLLKAWQKKIKYINSPEQKKEIQYLLTYLETNDDPVYGKGFQEVKKIVARMGVSYWLQYLRKYKALP
jgi:ribosomal protein L24E